MRIGRPAVVRMSVTRKSTQPEFSPDGAEISRSAVPLKSTPAGHARLAQQAFHATVRGGLDAAALGGGTGDGVEVLARFELADEELPRLRFVRSAASAALAFHAHGVVGLQVAGVGGSEDQVIGHRTFGGARVASRREAPAEDACRERPEVALPVCPLAETALPLDVAPVEDNAGPNERGGRHDQAGGPDEADPFEVGSGVEVGTWHGDSRRSVRPLGGGSTNSWPRTAASDGDCRLQSKT